MPTLITVNLERAGVPNANGRIYPKAVLEKAAATNHAPLMLVAVARQQVRLDTLLGTVQGLEVQGEQLKAHLLLVDTEAGQSISKLMALGYQPALAWSMVGRGTVINMEVQDDYVIEGVVFDPQRLCKDDRLRRVLLAKARASLHRVSATESEKEGERGMKHP